MSTTIFGLTAVANLATGDLFVVVDVSDTAQSANGSTRKVTLANLAAGLGVTNIGGQLITFAGPTAPRTITFPDASITVARTDATNTFTGTQTFLGTFVQSPAARTSGSAAYFSINMPADTTLAASTEAAGVLFSGATRQWATGNITTQRERRFIAPTFDFVGASTITNAINVDIVDPIAGANATFTNTWALRTASLLVTGNVEFDGSLLVVTPVTLSPGYLGIPQQSKSAAYTTVLSDAGKCIFHPSSDNNARTFTIDSNANVAYPIGTVLEFINMAATAATIAITSDTLTFLPAGTTGSRTLAQYGRASAEKISSTAWVISGNSALT